MIAKELRIGNYVNTANGIKRVTTVSVDGWSMHTESEPIPITEKWLLDFGFELVYESDYRKKYDYCKDYRFGYGLNKALKNTPEGVSFKGDHYTHVKYVHELQNLYFALTGKELILKKLIETAKKPTSEDILGKNPEVENFLHIKTDGKPIRGITNPTDRLRIDVKAGSIGLIINQKNMKLISMTAFIQQQLKGKVLYQHLEKVVNYSDFLIQLIELWMFVPCKLVGGIWVILEEPNQFNYNMDATPIENKYLDDLREYQEAKDRCLFEGFEYANMQLKSDNICVTIINSSLYFERVFEDKMPRIFGRLTVVEDLIQCNLELTPTAQKQIGF